MKKILDCFEYLKRYQVDLFESICIFLECFLLKEKQCIAPLLQKAQKRQKIYESYCDAVGQYTQVTPPNPHLNLVKILKSIEKISYQDLGIFFDLITQKKTNNKLFYYTTPLEVSTLLHQLVDLKEGESLYNPCFGLGSLFLQIPQGVSVYGEELDERFVKIASLICLLNGTESHLVCNDVLKQPSFRDKKGFLQFDKIVCNPPLHSHLGTNYIKEDERFSGLVSKSYPELVFFFHSLVHLKNRGVFILRKAVFKNLEMKLKDILLGRLECIVDLPKNIFPYQNHDFCIVIIGKHTEKILYIDAKSEGFWYKDGRYNRLKNLDVIVKLYHSYKESKYSKLVHHLDAIFLPDSKDNDGYLLCDLASVFKGQRVYGYFQDEEMEYFEVGVSDFAPLGFTQQFEHTRLLGSPDKIQKNQLKPYDILISWRGTSPKIAILSPQMSCLCVANMGVLVVRPKNKEIALGLYVYFFSDRGYQNLCDLCAHCLNVEKLKNFIVPRDIQKFALHMQEIERLSCQWQEFHQRVLELKEEI